MDENHPLSNVPNMQYLVIGASGFVGKHLVQSLPPENVLGLHYPDAPEGGVRFDALTMDLADVVESPEKITHAYILYGDTHPDSCARDPEKSRRLNVDSTIRVIDRLVEWKTPFTFTSSESVFNGLEGNYREDDPAHPILLYGAQKLEIETYLRDLECDCAVLRLGKVFGLSPTDEKLFGGWLKDIKAAKPIRCAEDQVFSPIHISDVIEGLRSSARKKLRGLYHLCGPKAYSRLELLNMFLDDVRRFRPVELEVQPCSIDDFPLLEKRPKDVSMCPDKFVRDTGIELQAPEAVSRAFAEAHFGTSDGNT